MTDLLKAILAFAGRLTVVNIINIALTVLVVAAAVFYWFRIRKKADNLEGFIGISVKDRFSGSFEPDDDTPGDNLENKEK